MTDPRRLTDAALAAIGERDSDDDKPCSYLEQIDRGLQARSDRHALIDHLAWQAERLAEAERDANASAEVVDQLVEAHRERQDLLTAMTQKVMEQSGQLASEKVARVAAEGQAAELRTALEKVGVIISLMFPGSTKAELQATINTALASPDRGASAVLAAADQLDADYKAWCKRPGDLEDFPDSVADLLEPFLAKVRTWRARRSGGTDG